MLYQVVIAAVLLTFLLNLILNVITLKRPKKNSSLPPGVPRVSILVPARDEEPNIRACLETLQKQDYPNFEMLVLDDNSTDNTAAIVQEMAASDDRIRLIQGEPLPEDWAGKPFACYQLARKASGDWLLFVDADTTHAPYMVRGVLSLALENKASLLSGFPRQLARSLPQRIAVPLFYFIIMSWVPLWWIHRSGIPRPSVAIGQFLLFPREEYWRFGGHKAVKSRILEDIWMGVEVTRKGGRHLAVNLSSVVFTNMYPTAAAMWRGLGRCIYSVAAINPVFIVSAVLVAWFCYMGPYYWLWNGFFMSDSSTIWRAVVISQLSMIFLMRFIVDIRLRAPIVSSWLHPIGITALFGLVLYSIWRWLTGSGVTWKERAYGKEESMIK